MNCTFEMVSNKTQQANINVSTVIIRHDLFCYYVLPLGTQF